MILLDNIIQILALSNLIRLLLSSLYYLIAAVLAPRLSMLIKPGLPFRPIALVRNRKAFFFSLLAVSNKSMVLPDLSTAL